MTDPRLDGTTLDVLDVLLQAWDTQTTLHGWLIMSALRRSGPRVYRALDRLEESGWVTATWEALPPGERRPRRRYYSITADRVESARAEVGRRVPRGAFPMRPRFGFGFVLRASSESR